MGFFLFMVHFSQDSIQNNQQFKIMCNLLACVDLSNKQVFQNLQQDLAVTVVRSQPDHQISTLHVSKIQKQDFDTSEQGSHFESWAWLYYKN